MRARPLKDLKIFFQHAGTGLKKFPLPAVRTVGLARILARLASEWQSHLPAQLSDCFPLAPTKLDGHRDSASGLLARMIAVQEELDWECYRLYGLINEEFRYTDETGEQREPPPLALGERAFEIVMARRMATGRAGNNVVCAAWVHADYGVA